MDIPIFKGEGEYSCGTTCLKMVLAYYGKRISQQELTKYNIIREGINYIYDLGYAALENNFKSIIMGYDFMLFNNINEKNPIDFLNKTNYIGISRQIKESCLNFLKKRGKLKIKIASLKDINIFIEKNIPIILGVRAKIIDGRCSTNILHYIVIQGYKKDYYEIVDPIGKKYSLHKNILLYAWYSRMGQLLIITPNN